MKLETINTLMVKITTVRDTLLKPMIADPALTLKNNALAVDLPEVPACKVPVSERKEYKVAVRRFAYCVLKWEESVKTIRLMRGEVDCELLVDITTQLQSVVVKLQDRVRPGTNGKVKSDVLSSFTKSTYESVQFQQRVSDAEKMTVLPAGLIVEGRSVMYTELCYNLRTASEVLLACNIYLNSYVGAVGERGVLVMPVCNVKDETQGPVSGYPMAIEELLRSYRRLQSYQINITDEDFNMYLIELGVYVSRLKDTHEKT